MTAPAVRLISLDGDTDPSDGDTDRCRNGHPKTPDNRVRVRNTNGRMYDACRLCRNEGVARVRARKRGEEVPMFGPKPKPTEVPAFATAELWTVLPKELRVRIAAVMMDRDPPDPLVAGVIRRVAKRRVWVKTGVHFGAIAYVEAVIEEVRDSTSTRLRIDKVLAVLLA